MSFVTPRPASTVVVVRDQPGGFEVLLVKRNDKVAFMAGAHVFPGGRVDAEDAIADLAACCDGVSALPEFTDLSAAEEAAYRVAAIRELVEEAGVLIARGLDGSNGSAISPEVIAGVRGAVASGEPLGTLAGRYGFRLAFDAFVPLAHWVTPENEPRRYDTRFFLATLPDGQIPLHEAGETTELLWMRPADSIARCERGEILLPPPTWTTLKQLVRHASPADVFAWARSRRIVRVQPNLVRDERQTMLTLPGDPLYPNAHHPHVGSPLMPSLPGSDVPEDTRFVLQEGRGWKPVPVS
jgi:8-oxo-dGTP pyrophosphatase MutT (NUDIX family)